MNPVGPEVNGPEGASEIAEPWEYIVGGGSALEFEEHPLDVLGIVRCASSWRAQPVGLQSEIKLKRNSDLET